MASAWMLRAVFGALVLSGAAASTAASFDCSKATSFVETTICGDEDLNRLDEDAARLYTETLKRNRGQEVDLRENQKAWLRQRDRCQTEDCILHAYLDRRGWYFSRMVPLTSAQDDLQRATETAKASNLHFVFYNRPDLRPDEGPNRDQRLFCEGFLDDFKALRNLQAVEPYAMAERYDDPAFDGFRKACPKLDMHKLSEGALTVRKTGRATDNYGFLFTPSHHFKLYHVDLDNAHDNGVEHVLYAESFFNYLVNRSIYNYYRAWNYGSCTNYSSEPIRGSIDHYANVPTDNLSGIIRYLGKHYIYNLFWWALDSDAKGLRITELKRRSSNSESLPVCVFSEIDCCSDASTAAEGKK